MKLPLSEQTRPSDDESGFTLLEMVISVIILALITGAISAAFVSSLTSTSATKHRVSATQDAQLISGFFTRDAQAAGGSNPALGTDDPSLGVTLNPGTSTNGCATPGTPLIGFKWIDQGPDTTYEANYSYVATATGSFQPQQLLRTICSTTSATPPVTSTGTSVLANNVVTAATVNSVAPVAWCDNTQSAPACPTAPPFPKTVNVALTILSTTDNVTTPYPFTLTASLRPQSGAVPDTSAEADTAPLLLLGGGSCATTSITGNGTTDLQVFGVGAVSSGCGTSDLGSAASTVIASDGFYVAAPGTCQNVNGTCTVITAKFSDPFAAKIQAGSLTAPSTAGCNGTPNPGPNGAGHYTPGTYPRIFNPTNATLDPGVYVFCAGVTVNGTWNATNALFFINGGRIDIQGTLNLSPPNAGQYAGLAIWQIATDNLDLYGGNGNITGTVYLPSARLNFKNGTDNITQVVAQGLDLNPGNNTTQIGAPLTITGPATIPDGTNGQVYPDTPVTATGGGGGYTWTATGIAGLTIDNTGTIHGTPNNAVGPDTLTVKVTDSFGNTATQAYPITIHAVLAITGTMPTWTVNQPGYTTNLTASGGTPGYTWSATGMPAGLTMQSNGSVTGSPTTATTYNPQVTITDSSNYSVTRNFTNVVINPLPKINNIVLSGNTQGKIEKNDTIVITFSQAMNPAPFCAGWDGTTTLNGIVTVNDGVSPGPPNDNVSVASAGCVGGLKVGTIDLKSFTYVSGGTVTFGATGTASTITLTGGTVLTIKLGNVSAGTVGTNQTSAPVYTASPGITDTTGAGLSSPIFNIPNGKQF